MKEQEIKELVQDEFSRLSENLLALLQAEANVLLKKLLIINKETKHDDSV